VVAILFYFNAVHRGGDVRIILARAAGQFAHRQESV
jgi:hypothetical protein